LVKIENLPLNQTIIFKAKRKKSERRSTELLDRQQNMKKKGRKPKKIKFDEISANGKIHENTHTYPYTANSITEHVNSSTYVNTAKFDLKPLNFLNQSTMNLIHSDGLQAQTTVKVDDTSSGRKQFIAIKTAKDTEPMATSTNYTSNNDINDNNFNFENKNNNDAYILTTLTCNFNNQTKFMIDSQQQQHQNNNIQSTNDFFLINELIERDSFKNYKLLNNPFNMINSDNCSDTMALLNNSEQVNGNKAFTKLPIKSMHESNAYDSLSENKLSMMMIVNGKKGRPFFYFRSLVGSILFCVKYKDKFSFLIAFERRR
jgi:hypothetical protein